MNIGDYTLTPVITGQFRLDGGAMFGVVPRVLWEKTNPPDEKNRIQMTMRALLLQSATRRILVDTGVGEKQDEKFIRMFVVEHVQASLTKSLSKAGLRPEDVTDVILTHLHFDHCGGSTQRQGDSIVPTFPHARYFVQRQQYEHALTHSERDRASYFPENFEPMKAAGQLELLDGPAELYPGVEILVVGGHTPGQQLVKVADGSKTLLYCADLIPTASHIPLPYIMAYDLFPMMTLEEKKRLLPQAHHEGWILFFEHDPFRATAKVAKSEKDYIMGDEVPLDGI
ncbi:MAG: MBL fold metallo-hydrolase [Calditrichaeota bacterium]|nr:MBL fold metallo-hydrolase [Calditrichota bacterium]